MKTDFAIIACIDQGYWSYIYIDQALKLNGYACNESIKVFDWQDTYK